MMFRPAVASRSSSASSRWPFSAVRAMTPNDRRSRSIRRRGQVLYKGKPLADALVVLRPVNPEDAGVAPPQPTGRTDGEGKFLLHTYAGDDGAPVGSYLVGVSAAPAYPETRAMMKKVEPAPKSAPVSIGTQYADPAKSGLKAEIKAGQNEVPTFHLD